MPAPASFRWTRKSPAGCASLRRPVILVANKAEGRAGETGVIEAMALGFGDPIPFSAEHGEGMVDLFDALRPFVDREDGTAEEPEERAEDGPLKLGPSSVAPMQANRRSSNRILGQDRLITGPEAGITRDSIAIEWEWTDDDGNVRPVRLIDTAGMRKKARGAGKAGKAVGDGRPARGRFRRGGWCC